MTDNMRRMRDGFKDRFPRLPPGVTPSDIDRHFGAQEPPEDHEGDPEDYCHVCCPPPDDDPRIDDWVFCDSHDMDDLRAKMEQEDHENPPPERWSGDHDGAD